MHPEAELSHRHRQRYGESSGVFLSSSAPSLGIPGHAPFAGRSAFSLLTFLSISAKIGFTAKDFAVNPGVAQLVGRLVWDQDAASSSLATRTMKNGCFRKKTTVFWTFKRIFKSAVHAQPGTHSFASRFIGKKLEW